MEIAQQSGAGDAGRERLVRFRDQTRRALCFVYRVSLGRQWRSILGADPHPGAGNGRPQPLEPFSRSCRIDTAAQLETLAAKRSLGLINASNPGKDTEKSPAN